MDARHCPVDGGCAEAVDTLPRGTRLGAYRIERLLGEGGMGFVYEATHEVLNRRSAIKMLRPELARSEQIVIRFLNEAKAVNLIDHQHIVNVYDYGDDQNGNVYFVMEYLEGETLDGMMAKRQPMQLPLILHVFGQIAKALAAAHATQTIHRDLKPANVLIIAREDNPYFVKLLDFGLAQLRGVGAVLGLTIDGAVMGTPQYMSPEQVSGSAVDARSDVWALGVMLYRAATGHLPFKGKALAALTDEILHHQVPPASAVAAVPEALSRLIASCLERQIADRCPSVEALLAELEAVKRDQALDDDAILAAVIADAGAVPPPRQEPTRARVAGPFPRDQGAGTADRGVRPAPRSRARIAWYAIAGVVVVAGAAYGALGQGREVASARVAGASEPAAPALVGSTAVRSIKDAFLAGDASGGRALAEDDLRRAIASGTLQQQGFAVDALAAARVPAGARLLYAALQAAPDVRVKAARALGELALPDAVPRLRAALAGSGDTVKVELAAVLFRLGDKDARAILLRATEHPTLRLTAATAMAESADDGGRAALIDVLAATPHGRDPWRRAAGGLMALGDANARALLEDELAQPDATRAVGAAELLARAGDPRAREVLARLAADKQLTRAGDAALALARLGDKRALAWLGDGLTSRDGDERKLALAVCGVLAADAAPHTGAIARLATDDPVLSVRMTAEAVLLGL